MEGWKIDKTILRIKKKKCGEAIPLGIIAINQQGDIVAKRNTEFSGK